MERTRAWSFAVFDRVQDAFAAAVFAVVLARFLGPEEFGRYVLILAAVRVAGVIGEMGLPAVIERSAAMNGGVPGRRTMRKILALRLLGVTAGAAFFILGAERIAALYGREGLTDGLRLGGLIFAFHLGATLPVAVLVARRRFGNLAGVRMARNILFGGLIAALYMAGAPSVEALWMGLAASGLFVWVLFAARERATRPEEAPDAGEESVLPAAGSVWTVEIAYYITRESALIILGYFRPEAEVGWFRLVIQGLDASALSIMAFRTVMEPEIAEHSRQREALDLIWKKARLIHIAYGFWAAWNVAFLGPYLVRYLLGEDYAPVVPLVRVSALALPAISWYLLGMAFLVYGGRPWNLAVISIAAAAANILLLILLVPRWGALGALIALVIVQGAASIASVGAARRKFDLSPLSRGALFMALLLPVPLVILIIPIPFIAGAALYLVSTIGLLYHLGGLLGEDLERAIAVYDGRCSVCRAFAAFLRWAIPAAIFDAVPCGSEIQGKLAPYIPVEACSRAFILTYSIDETLTGGEAASAALSMIRPLRPLAPVLRSPLGRLSARAIYRLTYALKGCRSCG